MQPLTPKQAYALLEQVTALVQTDRQTHIRILDALKTIKSLVDPENKPERQQGPGRPGL